MPLPAIIGTPRTFDTKHRFLVLIEGIISAEFQTCSELAGEIAVIEHHEGGANVSSKVPGRISFEDITLTRGVAVESDIILWFETVIEAASGLGLDDPLFKRDLTIAQLGRDGSFVKTYRVFNAWPMRYSAGDWDNTVDEIRIESVTLAFDFFERTT